MAIKQKQLYIEIQDHIILHQMEVLSKVLILVQKCMMILD